MQCIHELFFAKKTKGLELVVKICVVIVDLTIHTIANLDILAHVTQYSRGLSSGGVPRGQIEHPPAVVIFKVFYCVCIYFNHLVSIPIS